MQMQDKQESRRNRLTEVHIVAGAFLFLLIIFLAQGSALATVSAGNAFYQVHVQDTPGAGVGLYTATTGPSHPAGSGLNVLFGNGEPGTSFNTIRSYSSNTDYIQEAGKSSVNSTVVLDSLGTVTPLGSTGFRTTYVIGSSSNGVDQMTIIQDVNVNGTTFDDSSIEVTTTIANNSSTNNLTAGVRYFWDYQIGLDDGPVFQPVISISAASRGCNEFTTEVAFTNATFEAYRMVDNDVNPNPPTFSIFGTVNGPSTVTPLPTPPDLLQYVCWPSASGTAFEYTVNPTRDIATVASDCQSGAGGGDTAVSYFFGHDRASALLIPPGGSVKVSASLFLTPVTTSNSTCVTRTSRFWFTHQESSNPTCATLLSAILANCGGLDLGFLTLPNGFQDGGNVMDAEDAMIEALGLYWKGTGVTGEIGGTQSSKSKASALCTARKKMSVELIAAIANVQLLGADPSVCTFTSGKTNSTFGADLLDEARITAAGADIVAINNMTALLKDFNLSGEANPFPSGVVECSATSTKTLKQLARDPTTQATCPGVNNSCVSAEPIAFPSSAGSFSSAVFTKNVTLNTFTNSFPSPACGAGGRDASWKITPDVGTANRSFTASTTKANFDTMISIWEGTCSNLVAVSCVNSNLGVTGETITFQTDGVNTFFIVVEGEAGQYGKCTFKLTSP